MKLNLIQERILNDDKIIWHIFNFILRLVYLYKSLKMMEIRNIHTEPE